METTVRRASPTPRITARVLAATTFRVVAAVGLAALALLDWGYLGLQIVAGARGAPTDFATFHHAARRLVAGLSPYAEPLVLWNTPLPNLNHPALTLALAPLGWLPPTAAYLCWVGLSAALYAVAAAVVWRELRPVVPAGVGRLALLAGALNSGVLLSLALGQVSALLTLGMVAAWLLLRRGHAGRAGVALGVLIALKVFLLPVLGYFLLRRDRRGLACAAAGALGVSALALPVVGVAGYRDWLGTFGTIAWYGNINNISLIGVLYRAVPDPPRLVVATIAAGLPLAGLLALAVRRGPLHARAERDLAVLLALGMLSSPLGWSHYLPLLLPCLAGVAGNRQAWTPATRPALAACALVALVPYPLYYQPFAATLSTLGIVVLAGAAWSLGGDGRAGVSHCPTPPARRAASGRSRMSRCWG